MRVSWSRDRKLESRPRAIGKSNKCRSELARRRIGIQILSVIDLYCVSWLSCRTVHPSNFSKIVLASFITTLGVAPPENTVNRIMRVLLEAMLQRASLCNTLHGTGGTRPPQPFQMECYDFLPIWGGAPLSPALQSSPSLPQPGLTLDRDLQYLRT